MDEIDDEVRASLRRLGPVAPGDGVLEGVARHRDRLVRRRRAITVLASVVVVAILGGAIAVAASPEDDPDRVVVDSPTTPPQSTTTSSSSSLTSTSTTTSTTTTPTTTTSTTAPVDTTACTSSAVAVSLDLPPEHVFDGPQCVAGYAVVGICDPAGSEVCLEGRSVLALSDGRWSLLGRMLQDCLEDLLAYVPEDVAVRFDDHRWCSWSRLLEDAVLEPGGLGPIRIGMTVDEIMSATGLGVFVSDGVGVGGCQWADIGLHDVTLIVRAGVVVNITIYPARRTDRDFAHGSSQAAVLQAYPDAEVQPNVWDPNGLWIAWPALDHPQAIVYSTNGSVVGDIQAGEFMPEGCHS